MKIWPLSVLGHASRPGSAHADPSASPVSELARIVLLSAVAAITAMLTPVVPRIKLEPAVHLIAGSIPPLGFGLQA